MKCLLLISFVLFASVDAFSQNLEVLLIGTSHDYSKSQNQDLSEIQKRIRVFNPGAFFGEFVTAQDEVNLMDYWCKSDNLKRLKRLRANKNIPAAKLSKVIDSLKRISKSEPENFYIKTDLAHAYFLAQDVANAHYQYWQVFDRLQHSADVQLEKYLDDLLSPKQDVSGRSMKRINTSEYALLAFPMMREFKLTEMLSMDCQDYDLNWTASAVAFHEKFKRFQTDSLSADFKLINAILAKRDDGFGTYKQKESTSSEFTEWLNTDEAAKILASGDFFFPELYTFADFPKEEMLSQIHWWTRRNEEMCRNIVNRSEQIKAKRVVVIVGANHKKFMQDIFKKMNRVTVVTLKD